MDNENIEINERLQTLIKSGIQIVEIHAARACFIRENARRPNLLELVEYMEEYLKWREMLSSLKRGEIEIQIKVTEKGKKIEPLVSDINSMTEGG